jgi:diguanylate cyclase (GGDEF)-like protein
MSAVPVPKAKWLRSSEFDRARLLDMTRRIVPATLFASLLCGAAVVALLPAAGPALLLPLALGAGGQLAIAFVFPRMARPERWILAGDCLSVVTISWGVALTGGFRSPLVPLLVLPLVAVAGRHTVPVFVCFTALCLGAPVVAELVAASPTASFGAARAVSDLAVIAGVAAMTIALMRAEWHFRHQSLLDPLTGLLNRMALDRRFEELRAQAAHSDGVLCLIVADIDDFKAINDGHGHEAGDIVLREVASALRTSLRTFSLLYRVGGEEFVAILPGLGMPEGRRIAERLRVAVEGCRPRGIEVTMSFGVAASVGSGVDYDRLFAAADTGLYKAKSAGRNRVVAEIPLVPGCAETAGSAQHPPEGSRLVSALR